MLERHSGSWNLPFATFTPQLGQSSVHCARPAEKGKEGTRDRQNLKSKQIIDTLKKLEEVLIQIIAVLHGCAINMTHNLDGT